MDTTISTALQGLCSPNQPERVLCLSELQPTPANTRKQNEKVCTQAVSSRAVIQEQKIPTIYLRLFHEFLLEFLKGTEWNTMAPFHDGCKVLNETNLLIWEPVLRLSRFQVSFVFTAVSSRIQAIRYPRLKALKYIEKCNSRHNHASDVKPGKPSNCKPWLINLVSGLSGLGKEGGPATNLMICFGIGHWQVENLCYFFSAWKSEAKQALKNSQKINAKTIILTSSLGMFWSFERRISLESLKQTIQKWKRVITDL